MESAHRLLQSKEKDAFDLTLEPKESYEAYDTGRFGRGCLLARRLVEEGARFIEVTTEYVPFLHWDTHKSGHTTVARMKKEIDRPIAQLSYATWTKRVSSTGPWSSLRASSAGMP